MTSLISVSTSAARFQDISLNPQKLAGQCDKLKCCLNYEIDCYVEAQKRLPSREIQLETKDGTYFFFKADILSNHISYSTDKSFPANLVTITGKRAFEIINMNKKGMKPDNLAPEHVKAEPQKPVDLVEQESLTRFDRERRKQGSGEGGNRNKKKRRNSNNRPAQQEGQRDNRSEGNKPQQQQQQQAQPQKGEQNQQRQRNDRRNNNRPNRNNNERNAQRGDRPERGERGDRPRQNNERPNNRKGE